MGRKVECNSSIITNQEYVKIFQDYQDKINVINLGNKELNFKLKEFGKKEPIVEETAPITQTPPAEAEADSPVGGSAPIVDNSDNFIMEYEKIRFKTHFYEARLQMEAKLSAIGKCAVSINIDNFGNVYHSITTITELYLDAVGNPLKISVNSDEWSKDNRKFYLQETYDIRDKSIKRAVYSQGKPVKAEYCPYPFKEKDSFSDLDFIPVQVFKNNWIGKSDHAGLEALMSNAGALFDLVNIYAKMTLPRVIYKSFLNSSTTAEDVEKQFIGTSTELKVFIDLEDSDTEIQSPFQTLVPTNNIDKHINAVKEMLQFINRFSMTKKEVSDKGTVQQSTGEIGEMNSIPELYQFVKEEMRLRNFGDLATKTNKFMIAYTEFTGDEEAIYEAEFEKMDKKEKSPMPMNPFQIGNQNALVDPKAEIGVNNGEGK